jgi:hypothetical protein
VNSSLGVAPKDEILAEQRGRHHFAGRHIFAEGNDMPVIDQSRVGIDSLWECPCGRIHVISSFQSRCSPPVRHGTALPCSGDFLAVGVERADFAA